MLPRSGARYLSFLDGVRALTALYVFVSHAYDCQWSQRDTNPLTLLLFHSGYLAVDIFIVLSGFCLGLQAHKQQSFWQYLSRRSRRILPPYYAALTVCLLLILANAKLKGIDLQVPLATLVPNLLMVKELYPDHWLTEMAPFWTIGIEYRCYFILPALAWCQRRYGLVGLLASTIGFYALAATILALFHLPAGYTWLILLFGLGVAASQALERQLPIRAIVLALASILAVLLHGWDWFSLTTPQKMAVDVLFGAIAAFCLLSMAQRENLVTRLLAARWLGWLATWSYSLYLLHYCLLLFANRWLSSFRVHGWQAIALETVPILFACWLFSLVFEQPFQRR